MLKKLLALAAAASATLMSANAAQAVTITSPLSNVTAYMYASYGYFSTNYYQLTNTLPDDTYTFGSTRIQMIGDPLPYVRIQGDPRNAIAEVQYDYALLLKPTIEMPHVIDDMVKFSGQYSLAVYGGCCGYGSVTAETSLNGTESDGHIFTDDTGDGRVDLTSFTLNGPGELIDGGYLYNGETYALYRGHIRLNAHMDFSTSYISEVYIDPVITANVQALQNAGFDGQSQLLLSPGVGNGVGGVPEPASWALMIGGFGLIGTAARRRQVALA